MPLPPLQEPVRMPLPLRPWLDNARAALLDALFPRRRALRALRARWGRPGSKDGWLASGYFDLVRERGAAHEVDDKTWRDLEFPQLFARIDATVTPVGSQVLFRQMRRCVDDPEALAARHAMHARLRVDALAREALQRALLPLQDDHHARIADFLLGEPATPLRHPRLLRAWALASAAALVAAFAWPWMLWVWLAMLLVNAIVLVRIGTSGRTLRDMQTLEACLRLVKVSDDLAALREKLPWLPPLAALADERPNRAKLARRLGWLMLWVSLEKVFPVSILALFLDLAVLAKLVLHVRAMQGFAELRGRLAASFQSVGEVDAAIAVASWQEGHPCHCQPTLGDRLRLDITDGRHPLLTDGVANSVCLDGRSALVTGSNMAGKTTFIKMLAVNALLAQTLGFCMATRATIPRARVLASIQAAHSVESGKSHYFSEVETIQAFLELAQRGTPAIFAIDELFSGTNTVERVAIARAVLESLARGALVLATTHDVELQALLARQYDLHHFQESPEVDGYFDYRLRRGPAIERNAIRLLREVGFPESVVATAMDYAERHADAPARPA